MSDQKNKETTSINSVEQNPSRFERKPYQKPGFIVSRAFERQALSCAGCVQQSAGFPNFCSNQSG